jgi:thiamine-phosphate pyrophosphorylase
MAEHRCREVHRRAQAVAREIIGPGPLVGLSTHAEPETAGAAGRGEWTTSAWAQSGRRRPSQAGLRPACRCCASRRVFLRRGPFAIGGISLASLDEVLAAGARRVVVVRALTGAADPAAAAAALAARLAAAV